MKSIKFFLIFALILSVTLTNEVSGLILPKKNIVAPIAWGLPGLGGLRYCPQGYRLILRRCRRIIKFKPSAKIN